MTTDSESYNKIVGPVEGLKSISTTFMVIVLIFGGIIISFLSSIAIRERKYEISVLRAMGMKKHMVAPGLWSEMLLITCLCLVLGIGVGTLAA
ncbi:putative ABC transport system permease protein [Evansella caseinilytica]|uniref:Putative ABC transport system permease protein n=1 Tax=Evansella caseinilytica TaxID=1503961 RepID=A0A1H3SVT3_9BACI|nr:putative ABC transport system permease protein [Evansella caseinilytica]